MTKTVNNLDRIIRRYSLDCRLETSATLGELKTMLGAMPKLYSRDGLGEWQAFPVEVSPYGEFVVAAPSHDLEAGCSIWFAKSLKLSNKIIAAIICVITGDYEIKFANADGTEIVPDKKVLRMIKSNGESRKVNTYSRPLIERYYRLERPKIRQVI